LASNDVFASPGTQPAPDAAQLAASGVTIFADTVERLGALRTRLGEMGADLEAFAKLAEGGAAGTEATGALGRRVAAASTVLRETLDPDRAASARADLAAARRHIFAIGRVSRTLGAVVTLTRATAGSYGVQALAGYLSDLSQIALAVRENAGVVDAQLGQVAAARGRILESATNALDRLEGMEAAIDAAEAGAAALLDRERRAGSAVASEAAALQSRGKAQMKAFVAIVQFSDRLAQRLDHLGAILAHDDPHAQRLGAAQIASICAAIGDTAAQAEAAAREIGAIAHAGGALFLSGEIADSIGESVRRRAALGDAVAAEMGSVEATLHATRDGVARATAATAEARDCFSRLEGCARDVAAASINSTLLSSRAGAASAPLTTLALEVRLVAAQCMGAIDGCRTAMDGLADLGASAHAELLGALDALGRALSAYRIEVDAGAERLAALTALSERAAARMTAMGREVAALEGAVPRIRGLAAALDALGRSCVTTPPDAAPDPAVLRAIWGLYTMDEERAVHAELFGAAAPQKAAAAAAPDLDDVFF